MDLLLCSSYYFKYELLEGARSQPYAPLGILYLASYLRDRGDWEVGVFDATFASGEHTFERVLKRLQPRVVGIQGVITTRRSARRMIGIAKEAGAVVVVGGPDPSVCIECHLSGYTVPPTFTNSVPGVFTHGVPDVFTNSVPPVFSQTVPPWWRNSCESGILPI